MDDGYLICSNKEELKKCLFWLKILCSELEIKLNTKKTHIKKISKGFEYLKARFCLLKNGKIIVKPNKKNISKNRRKLKKMKALVNSRKITFEQVKCFYVSVMGNLKHFNAFKTRSNFKQLFNILFKEELSKC